MICNTRMPNFPIRKILDSRWCNYYIPKSKFIRRLLMKNFIKVMKALSDPNRVKIVKMLQHKMMCVCELREALELA
jgi:hypothetical protein